MKPTPLKGALASTVGENHQSEMSYSLKLPLLTLRFFFFLILLFICRIFSIAVLRAVGLTQERSALQRR